MDLKKLAKSSLAGTFTFNLLHPETGEELGVKMSVVSAKSDKAFAFMRKKMKKNSCVKLRMQKAVSLS